MTAVVPTFLMVKVAVEPCVAQVSASLGGAALRRGVSVEVAGAATVGVDPGVLPAGDEAAGARESTTSNPMPERPKTATIAIATSCFWAGEAALRRTMRLRSAAIRRRTRALNLPSAPLPLLAGAKSRKRTCGLLESIGSVSRTPRRRPTGEAST